MERNLVETLMGAVVLTVAVLFAFLAYQTSGYRESGGSYMLQARFDSVDGIGVGSDIRIGGIKVGVVEKMILDMKTYLAVVTFVVDDDVELPSDSSAAVVSEGLLGGRYIALTPGGDVNLLKDGEEIAYTQSSVNLESLIGRFMFNGGLEEGSDSDSESSSDDGAFDFGLEDDLEAEHDMHAPDDNTPSGEAVKNSDVDDTKSGAATKSGAKAKDADGAHNASNIDSAPKAQSKDTSDGSAPAAPDEAL